MLIYCIYLYQDTTLQANHNFTSTLQNGLRTVFIYIKIQLCKQTTTEIQNCHDADLLYLSISRYNFASKPQLCWLSHLRCWHCIYLYQDTTLQANHNPEGNDVADDRTVFIYIKIQLCKQTKKSKISKYFAKLQKFK